MVPDCRAKANRRAALHKGAFHHQLVIENHSKLVLLEREQNLSNQSVLNFLAFLDIALFKKKEHKTGAQSYLECSVAYASTFSYLHIYVIVILENQGV